ncbi:TonB-dependent receptor plug domain-containing protein [Chryseobacterium sp. POE27]|uniref:TonB-dependent receptor plug domain-containing protein n=1 Tax=Chryseobacterium sp. POE27 TaxID=3138177 RepID=UPI00321A02C9
MKLTIPAPCHENWDTMTPDEKGRFCSVCSKTVRDFTVSSDREVMKAFSRPEDHICGRFNASQLNRNLQYSEINSVFVKFAVGFMLTAGGLIAVHGQQNTINDSTKTEDAQEVVVTGYKPVKKSMVTGLGTIVSEDIINGKQEDKSSTLAEKTRGVTVNPPSTNSSNRIRIGGAHRVSEDSQKPLVVLDQKIVSLKVLEEIDPQSIESLNILKDAAATSIYGSQAKNGVIIITTKNHRKLRKRL